MAGVIIDHQNDESGEDPAGVVSCRDRVVTNRKSIHRRIDEVIDDSDEQIEH
jgi:hypothetical protein